MSESSEQPLLPPMEGIVHFSTTWGPPKDKCMFPEFDLLPFRTFSRNTKIGKVSDFGGYLRHAMRGRFSRSQGEQHSELDLRGDAGAEDEEGGQFTRVDTSKVSRKTSGWGGGAGGRGGYRGGGRGGGRAGDGRDNRGGNDQNLNSNNNQNKRINKLNRARWAESGNRGGQGGRGGGPSSRTIREFSVKIQPDWLQLETVELSKLKELTTPPPPPAKDLKWTGLLEAYDEEYDKVVSRAPRKLKRFEAQQFFFKKAQEDPVLCEYAEAGLGNVIATDTVLSHLMTCTRSVYPWDIVANYLSGTIVLDVRDPMEMELHTVSETANAGHMPDEKEAEDVNGRVRLAIEATSAHENFTQQVLAVNNGKTPEVRSASEPVIEDNPLWDPVAAEALAAAEAGEGADKVTPQPASMAFRYRSFTVGKDISLIARTTIHAVQRKRGVTSSSSSSSSSASSPSSNSGAAAKSARAAAAAAAAPGAPSSSSSTTPASTSATTPSYLQLYTLLEWDPKLSGTPEWRTLVDAQRGSLLSTEIKNNSHKLAKFTASALLAGADSMRLGFVSRATRTDPYNHVIQGTHAVAPGNFATSLQLAPGNMWGILKWVVDLVRKHAKNLQEGVPDEEYSAKFVLARDPITQVVHFYSVPVDAFDREEEEGEGEGGEGEEGEAQAW